MSTGTAQMNLPGSAAHQRPAMLQIPAPAPVVNLENVEDFSKVCRVCAAITDLVMPIYSGEGQRNNLAEKINKHLPITVAATDPLPQVICYQCASTLLAAHELAQCSLQADAALRTSAAARARTVEERQQAARAAVRRARARARAEENAGAYRRCGFCPQVLAGAEHEAHLLALHTALIFHCDECDSFIARKNFLAHMTAHAAHYEERARPEPRADAAADTTTAPADSTTRPADADGVIDISSTTTEDVAERDDDFFDQSDAEPFALLPEAVLNVIEDSQEAPPAPEPDVVPPAVAPAADPEPAPAADPEPAPAQKNRRLRQCPHCPKKYTASSSYFYHLKYVHKQSREHSCKTCARRFGTRGALRVHEALHEPAAGLQCDTCGKRFRSKASHYIHAQTHTDERKFACEECGRAFRWLAALRRHATRHAARRQHRCGACDKAFNVRADMLRHARTHERAAHRCPDESCAATFAQERYLRAHVSRKHKAAQPEPPTRKSA